MSWTQLPLPLGGRILVLTSILVRKKKLVRILVLTPINQYLVERKIREVIKPLHKILRWRRAEVGVQVTGVLSRCVMIIPLVPPPILHCWP